MKFLWSIFILVHFSCHAKDMMHQVILRLRSLSAPHCSIELPNDERSATQQAMPLVLQPVTNYLPPTLAGNVATQAMSASSI